MTRRTIQRADEAMVRRVAMRALGGSAAVLFWNGPGAALSVIQVDMGGGHSRVMRDREVEALDAAGIHVGASGWEIEDVADAVKPPRDGGCPSECPGHLPAAGMYCEKSAGHDGAHFAHRNGVGSAGWYGSAAMAEEEASPAYLPLPRGFGWFERGVDSYSLDGPDGKPIARARASTVVPGTGVWQIGDGPWWPVASLPDAKRAAEDACRAAGLFDAAEPMYRRVARALGVRDEGRVLTVADVGSDMIQRVEVDGVEVGEGTLDVLRAAGFKVRPKVEAVADGSPSLAARMLFRAVACIASPPPSGVGRASWDAAGMHGAETFVREMRREVAPAEEPRGIEDAAGAFVGSRVERDPAWYKGQAEAAIEEARTANARAEAAERERDEAREEARVSDLNAVELAADLAKLREGIRDLAARMGAPHG